MFVPFFIRGSWKDFGKEEADTYSRTTHVNHMQVGKEFLCDGCKAGNSYCVVEAHILDLNLGSIQECRITSCWLAASLFLFYQQPLSYGLYIDRNGTNELGLSTRLSVSYC